MTALLELLAAIFLWKWADRQDEKAEADGLDTVRAIMEAPDAAMRWNLFDSEHGSQVAGRRRIDT